MSFLENQPQAVAATSPVVEASPAPQPAFDASSPTDAPADAAGGGVNPRRLRRIAGIPVPDIAPAQGWVLMCEEEIDGDGFATPAYFARGRVRDVRIAHSRFQFCPTQARFDYLARHGFVVACRANGPIRDIDVDRAIAAERHASGMASFVLAQSVLIAGSGLLAGAA